MLNRLYKLDQSGTTIARELQAGATTFAAMAYILAVNPTILSAAEGASAAHRVPSIPGSGPAALS